jgi:uncharacterized phage protein (TIGR02220 family)
MYVYSPLEVGVKMQGWIKLHRAVMKSDTFSRLTAIQQLITIYIILNANHEDGVWYDKYKDIEVSIKRGQVIVSRNKIANEWFKGDKEVTEQKVRTTLKKLEKLGFLTITSTNNYTVLEVLNYNVYQSKEEEPNQVSNQELTKSQPSNNQVSTTNKNDKNVKNDKNEEEKEYIPFSEVVSYLNQKANTNYRASGKDTKDKIKARWNDGFRLADFKKVIDIKTAEWLHDSHWSKFLRPSTLFGTKFESYLNQKEVSKNENTRQYSDLSQYNFEKERDLNF